MALWQLQSSDAYIVVFCILLCAFISRINPSKRLPPGPTKLPIIGNLLNIPKNYAWEVYASWSKKYGSYFIELHLLCASYLSHTYFNYHVDSDILHLNALGTSLIILNSFKSAKEIMEKRSASSR